MKVIKTSNLVSISHFGSFSTAAKTLANKVTVQVLETGDLLGEVTEYVEYYTEGNTIAAGNLFGRYFLFSLGLFPARKVLNLTR